jgi:hypothetical protein
MDELQTERVNAHNGGRTNPTSEGAVIRRSRALRRWVRVMKILYWTAGRMILCDEGLK